MALIPARSGSKGVENKNMRDFHGKPLLAWAVEVGFAACGNVWVSTDYPQEPVKEILRSGANGTGHRWGVISRREELSGDEVPMLPVVYDAIIKYAHARPPDVVLVLQPTQPMRTVEHVTAALRMLEDGTGASSVVSVVEIPAHYSPGYALTSGNGGRLLPYDEAYESLDQMPKRRQDSSRAYSRDGTVYAIRRETIEAGSLYGQDCRALVIPSNESCNIDTEEDWLRAESMVSNGRR